MKNRVVFDILVHPTHELMARCSGCGKELARESWESYYSYDRVKRRMEKKLSMCKYCGAEFFEKKNEPQWEKTQCGWKAKCKSGAFVIYRDGRGWKGHYSTFDESYFFFLSWRSSVAEMKKACEASKYWVA